MTSKSAGKKMMLQQLEKRIKRGNDINVGINNTTIITPPNLSDDVIEKIITCLPIKDAASCGALAMRFKNSWRCNPNFIFDLGFAIGRRKEDFMSTLNCIFSQHSGPKIEKFRLYFDPTDNEALVEYWIQMVTSKGVEEVDLDFRRGDEPFNLPSHLLECESVSILKLNFCQFELPHKLKGLSFLKTLVLRKINVTLALIATIFSNCLLLEGVDLVQCLEIHHLNIAAQDLKKFRRLVVGDCKEISHVEIDAPTLSTFYYRGEELLINFKSQMPHFKDVILNFTPVRGFPQLHQMSSLMDTLSNVKVLRISTTFLEKLSLKFVNEAYRKVQFSLQNLKAFQLFTDGAISHINPHDIVSFLEDCPNVETVFLDLGEYAFESGFYWEMHAKQLFEKCNPNFQRLKRIIVNGFKFEKLEMELLRFFLNKARFIDKVELVPAKKRQSKVYSRDQHLYDQLFDSWKTSPNAKISICKSIELVKIWSI